MEKETRIVKLKLDIIFKRIFGNENNKNIIAAFISDLLEIPREDIKAIYLSNVELAPEYIDQKFSRLDIKMDVDGRIVNIEMQVNREPDFKDRTLFYWSKLYSDELKVGDDYGELKQTICINIINFNLFDCDDYHSNFKILENDRKELLTDKFSIHFFELKKIGKFKKNRRMEDWLALINAETEAELMEIQNKSTIPEIHETIVKLRELSADEKLRQEAYYREKRLHDEASAIRGSLREGMERGMAKGMAKGRAEGMAKGMAKGRTEERNIILENMKKNGFTEEQIKLVLGNETDN